MSGLSLDEIDELGGDDSDPNSVELDGDLVTGWLYAYRKAKEWAEQAKDLRAEIEATMGEAECGTVGGRQVIRWARHKKRSLNQAALKKDHHELVESYYEMREERRFEPVEEGEAE